MRSCRVTSNVRIFLANVIAVDVDDGLGLFPVPGDRLGHICHGRGHIDLAIRDCGDRVAYSDCQDSGFRVDPAKYQRDCLPCHVGLVPSGPKFHGPDDQDHRGVCEHRRQPCQRLSKND
jgi:hypothetical protein